MDFNQTEFNGACHCGTVRFRIKLANGLHTARRCTCSLCRMRGAVAVTAKAGDLKILQGQDALQLYQFNTRVAKHYFCSKCGVYTHHQRRSNPDELGVNVACLAGVGPFDFLEVPVMDGINHGSDMKSGKSKLAGILRFFPSVE